jgi:hypothetical protein
LKSGYPLSAKKKSAFTATRRRAIVTAVTSPAATALAMIRRHGPARRSLRWLA